jgi:hypothetical protein
MCMADGAACTNKTYKSKTLYLYDEKLFLVLDHHKYQLEADVLRSVNTYAELFI